MSFEGGFPKGAKQPPPQHGIKVREMGTTWWGQRWIKALEQFSRDYLSRLGRGRTYARTGRVHDLKIAPGLVTAWRRCVTGSKPSVAMNPFGIRAVITSTSTPLVMRMRPNERRLEPATR